MFFLQASTTSKPKLNPKKSMDPTKGRFSLGKGEKGLGERGERAGLGGKRAEQSQGREVELWACLHVCERDSEIWQKQDRLVGVR